MGVPEVNCPVCHSHETVFVASHRDASVEGGLVHERQCTDCGHIYHDAPPEVVDVQRDRKMTDEFETDNA